MLDRLDQLMREATLLTQAGRLSEATAMIQAALRGGAAAASGAPLHADPQAEAADPMVIDGCVFEVEPGVLGEEQVHSNVTEPPLPAQAAPPQQATAQTAAQKPSTTGTGEFIAGTHATDAGVMAYKLFVPPGRDGRSMPMVVMLHGCTQNPDDFAAGTGMNELAREQGFFVLYPAQSKRANAQGCWNWFKPEHQARGKGEPAAIAAVTQAVAQSHRIDARRVYIAGLSAGGAMADVVAHAYPDLFAAVGVHLGLPRGAARTLAQALTVMKSGPRSAAVASAVRPAPTAPTTPPDRPAVPTIVFHGDQDATVHPRNGEAIAQDAVNASAARADAAGPNAAASDLAFEHADTGVSAHGRRFTRRTHGDADGRAVAEHWLVHGSGHAWSGGSAKGSYTDPQGPDASAEMLRFFLTHALA